MTETKFKAGIYIRGLVAQYCAEELHPNEKPFEVDGPFTPDTLYTLTAADKAGCYVTYGQNTTLRYIGQSERIARRAVTHFARRVQESAFWSDGSRAHFVDLIPVNKPWQRFSLEEYLYDQLGGAKGVRATWDRDEFPELHPTRNSL